MFIHTCNHHALLLYCILSKQLSSFPAINNKRQILLMQNIKLGHHLFNNYIVLNLKEIKLQGVPEIFNLWKDDMAVLK